MRSQTIALSSALMLSVLITFFKSDALEAKMNNDPTIYFAIEYNFNLNYAECPVEKTHLMVTQGHEPLLEVLLKHPKVKNDLFLTGYTEEWLQKHRPRVIELIKRGLKSKQFEVGTYSFDHPIFSLIPYEDACRQIELGLKYDEKAFGFRPKGFLLPEVAWDVLLPEIMKKYGLEWVIIYKEIVPKYKEEDLYPGSVLVEGINDTYIPAILGSNEMNGLFWAAIEGITTWGGGISIDGLQRKIEEIYEKVKQKGLKGFLLSIKLDAEIVYFASVRFYGKKYGDSIDPRLIKDRLDRVYTMLEGLPFIKFTTVGDYLAAHPPKEKVYAESMAGNNPESLNPWLRGGGRERLNVLTDQARARITQATYAIELAEKQGMNVKEAKNKLEDAWYQLLLSENSDGRGYNPHSSRKIFVANAAVKAVKLASEAVDAIKK